MKASEARFVQQSSFSECVAGSGPAMQCLNEMVAEIAPTSIPVLLIGECGTGKDTYARLIHRLSQKPDVAFHRIDCASLESADSFRGFDGQPGDAQSERDWGTIYL